MSAALASAMDMRRRVLARWSRGLLLASWPRFAGDGAVEDGAAVVGQLGHALADVLQGAVATLLGRRRLVDLGQPAPAELLDGGDVDRAVVEEVLDLGQLGGQEAPVGPDGVAGQGDGAGLGDVRLEEGQGLGAGVGQGQRRRLHGRSGDPSGCAWCARSRPCGPAARARRARPGRAPPR